MSLAEKYRDFDILIEICEDLQDQDKLQHYMNLFNTEVRLGQIISKYINFLIHHFEVDEMTVVYDKYYHYLDYD